MSSLKSSIKASKRGKFMGVANNCFLMIISVRMTRLLHIQISEYTFVGGPEEDENVIYQVKDVRMQIYIKNIAKIGKKNDLTKPPPPPRLYNKLCRLEFHIFFHYFRKFKN